MIISFGLQMLCNNMHLFIVEEKETIQIPFE